MKIERILTDNPYVDTLVYYVKLLAYGTVIKNEQKALDNETLESLKASDKYISAMEGHAIFEQMDYPLEVLQSIGLSDETIQKALIDCNAIPEDKRPLAMAKASEYCIAHYVETNNYYRMLNGLPDMNTPGIKITDWVPPEGTVIDLNKYIHEMNDLEIDILTSYGIIEKVIDANITQEYLKHLGEKKVGYYSARKGFAFQTLYIPKIDSAEIYDKFKSRLDVNRDFTLRTIYSEAFKYGSDYYDSFITTLIVVMTMVDILCEIQEFIARKEILDLRCIQYIFQSYGIPFYPEIPLKYQISMVKNINKLLKFKSTSKNMIDICSLFGFDNIEVFKYFLLRDRRIDPKTGLYEFHYKEIPDPAHPGQMITVDDDEKNYELKFVRVPLDDQADKFIRDPSNYLDYNDVVSGDRTWNGSNAHEVVKRKILDQEFNYARTKYISIDTIYEVTKMAFQMPYFFNMVFDDVKLEELLSLVVPSINSGHTFKMTDIFSFLYSLTYEYYDLEDDIVDTTGKVLHVLGFNFKANMAELATYVQKKGFTMKELGVDGFIIPKSSILSYTQLMDIFVKNGAIRTHLVKQIVSADNKRIYDIYTDLYNALMITQFTNDYYRDPVTGVMPKTYTAYLMRRDNILFQKLEEIHAIVDKTTKIQSITTLINNIVYALDEYIDSTDFKYIYANLPSVSSETVKSYVVKVINFFKSYKVDFLGMNTIYKFDDKMDNTIKIIDEIDISRILFKQETAKIFDNMKVISTSTPSERIALRESVYLDRSRWVNLRFTTDVGKSIRDTVVSMMDTFLKDDKVEFKDDIKLKTILEPAERDMVKDVISLLAKIVYSDNTTVVDKAASILSTIYNNENLVVSDRHSLLVSSKQDEKISTNDIMNIVAGMVYTLKYNMPDSAMMLTRLIGSTKYLINSDIAGMLAYMSLKDRDSTNDKTDTIMSTFMTSELYNAIVDNKVLTTILEPKTKIDIRDGISGATTFNIYRNQFMFNDGCVFNSIVNSEDRWQLNEMLYIDTVHN